MFLKKEPLVISRQIVYAINGFTVHCCQQYSIFITATGETKPHGEVVNTFMLVRILCKALHMHPRSRQNWRRAMFSLISGWLCILSLRLTLCLGQIRNPKWFYKKFTTIKQYCLIPQMDKTNYYSSMIHKPGLKIVNLPMCIASYNTIDIKYAGSSQRHWLL